MIGPVHHVVGRHHDKRLDALVAVGGCALVILLMVVGAIYIETAIILPGSGVGTELEVEQRVGHACAQLRRSHCGLWYGCVGRLFGEDGDTCEVNLRRHVFAVNLVQPLPVALEHHYPDKCLVPLECQAVVRCTVVDNALRLALVAIDSLHHHAVVVHGLGEGHVQTGVLIGAEVVYGPVVVGPVGESDAVLVGIGLAAPATPVEIDVADRQGDVLGSRDARRHGNQNQ